MKKELDMPDRGTLPDSIAEEIRQQVVTRLLVPGDSLPTETALAAQYGVSRNVVREALARLRSDGVIDTRRGRGPVVLDEVHRTAFRIEASATENPDSLAALFRLRRLLETSAARFAAESRSAEDVARLSRTMEKMRRSTGLFEDLFRAKTDFHQTVGQASGNPYMSTLICYLSPRLIDLSRKNAAAHQGTNLLEVNITEHQRIYEAIIVGDPDAAETAMGTHIDCVAARNGAY